ncbi:hypothetical protein QM806_04380 [Rhodococcus sp. IEGM 1351]|uniref:hypothetical protein n=1 Tax=Rhodococcus sp. IEGM 1351 TaxID=3047089 RepID=UPI0024B70D80|nr:hypothetical protein [Rhodococcus sp. IEGM 1351]MDI9934691.1 hypothetical protein [Rhodococcus sp. IEGM 1351]
MTVVTFNVDQYPYCKGDQVNLSDDQLKEVDAEAERRSVKDTYTVEKGAAEKAAPAEAKSSDEPKAPVQAKTKTKGGK